MTTLSPGLEVLPLIAARQDVLCCKASWVHGNIISLSDWFPAGYTDQIIQILCPPRSERSTCPNYSFELLLSSRWSSSSIIKLSGQRRKPKTFKISGGANLMSLFSLPLQSFFPSLSMRPKKKLNFSQFSSKFFDSPDEAATMLGRGAYLRTADMLPLLEP